MHMFKLNDDIIARLKNSKIQFSYRSTDRAWIDDGLVPDIPNDAIFAEDYASYFVRTDFYTIGAFSYSWSPLPSFVSMGRYCSIAGDVAIMPFTHPTDLFTTSSMVYDPDLAHRGLFYYDNGYENNDCFSGAGHPTNNKPITIGNDVYIATGARIRAGVTIGDGAIIGAYSVVPKSIEPYSVVIGNPARVVRQRYSEKHVEKLLSIKWWDWDFRAVMAIAKDALIDEFIDNLSFIIDDNAIKKFEPKKNYILALLSG